MKTNMPPSPSLYKTTALFLVIFFLLSFTVMAFDYHNSGISPACSICNAKNSLNDTQHSCFVLFHPAIASFYSAILYYKSPDQSLNISTTVSISREGRAPPESA
jgi:hypothetical protein